MPLIINSLGASIDEVQKISLNLYMVAEGMTLRDALDEIAAKFDLGGPAMPATTLAEDVATAETTTRRRSRGTAEEPVKAKPEAEPEAATGRRRSARTTEPEKEPEAAPAPSGRRRRSSEPEAPAGISDADLTKAASLAAEVLGPEVVAEILKEDFEVEMTSEIPMGERQEFLDLLKQNVEAAK